MLCFLILISHWSLHHGGLLGHWLSVDNGCDPLDHGGHLLLVLAPPHLLHLVSVDLAVAVNIERGVTVQIARGQPVMRFSAKVTLSSHYSPLHAVFLPESVRKVSEAELEHPEPDDGPPDLH